MHTYVIQDTPTGKFFFRESPSHHGVWVDSPFDASVFGSANSAGDFARRVLCLNMGAVAIVSVR
jgi:hypothetical protein